MKHYIRILVVMFMVVSETSAFADWFCTEEAAERKGNAIYACGVGQDEDEAEARHNALATAQIEFQNICGMSSDCQGHEIITEPGRTECVKHGKELKCFRLVIFRIGDENKNFQMPRAYRHYKF